MNADDVDIPNPGSDAAIDLGCTCPVIDNGHGHAEMFVYAVGCPVHDKRDDRPANANEG